MANILNYFNNGSGDTYIFRMPDWLLFYRLLKEGK